MKIYVRAMSLERSKALRRAGEYSQEMIEHIIKVLAYSDIRELDVDHWISEIAQWLSDTDNLTVKPKNSKLKKDDIMHTTFSSMGDELRDYESELNLFLHHNRRGYFNYENKESYPEFEITSDLVAMFKDCCTDIIDETITMLVDKQDHSKEEYKEVLRTIFNRYI